MRILLLTFIIVSLSSSIIKSQVQPENNPGKIINPENMDLSVNPNYDFYEYSNGEWLKKNLIPPDYGSWGSWNEIIERNKIVLKKILEDASAKKFPPGSNLQKLGDLYFLAMDTVEIEKLSSLPLKKYMNMIDDVQNKNDLIKVFSVMKSYRGGGLFNMWAGQDDKNSKNVILQFSQGGLGMPDRDYYLKNDEKSETIKSKYYDFMKKMFELMGNENSTAAKISDDLMSFETKLAYASMSRTEMREAEATYHLMSLNEVKLLMPEFNFDLLFKETGLEDQHRFDNGINIGQPEFFKEINRMLADINIETWKNYLKWNLVRNAANFLSTEFSNESFNFYSKILRGTEQKLPRWKESINFVEQAMGELLGREFVKIKFKPEAKDRALEMVANIKEAFGERLKNNEWMSDETKKQALKKLGSFNVKIGYTDKWKDYSGLVIDRKSFYENMLEASKYNMKLNLDKIGKPVDYTEWGMNPQTVNAYYNASKNEIVFPAGIMQIPFFDPDADDAVNYGSIGAVIGHEITHGFDDQGRKYDAEGNMKDWWTKEDASKFTERADKLVKQYNEFLVVDDLHVNGQLTLGENIADLGGIIIAYYGLQKTLEGKEKQLIDGFTPEQRFFLSYSQLWKVKSRPEAIRLQIKTDPHSPGKFRVIGPISNLIEFMKAFNGNPGDPMIRSEKERVVIW
ncbi:MAG: Neutral endopeptidase [Ignavibacteria bacterium]|nr:Neutral endopeptidase [Ignavibacteria bacterium]